VINEPHSKVETTQGLPKKKRGITSTFFTVPLLSVSGKKGVDFTGGNKDQKEDQT
jgi:hypothetical protein